MAAAAFGSADAPYEVVYDHVDIEAQSNGGSVTGREVRYRILTQEGIERLHGQQLSFTLGYQRLSIDAAYTLKADGRKIVVPQNNVLWGNGQSSQKGFQDRQLATVYYPNLEVGDSIVLRTIVWQTKPWFDGTFDFTAVFDRRITQKDVVYTLTAPEAMTLQIDAKDMTAGAEGRGGGKVRREWKYESDAPLIPESDAVDAADYSPHLIVSSFDGYPGMAAAYRARAAPQAKPTDEIAALAESLTKGVTDKREQAHILYDWVSTHIAYVGIVLGAGGFIPHPAASVLSNLYGDCKDHVVLLEALLAAKNIASTAVLVNGGSANFTLSPVASTQVFDHAITYLPDFDLYVDSTAELSPFGTLPNMDAGKPALRIDTGARVETPVNTASGSTLHLSGSVKIDAEGNIDGKDYIRASGDAGTELRGVIQALPPGKDNEMLRAIFGPGADGKIDRGSPRILKDPYEISADFRIPVLVAWPGPSGLPFHLSFLPLNVFDLVTGRLPEKRNSDYVCPSLGVTEDLTIELPAGTNVVSLPASQTLVAPDLQIKLRYSRANAQTLKREIDLKIDHRAAYCTPTYYAAVRPQLVKMIQALRQQIVVQRQTAEKTQNRR